ncbi:MAG: thioredoxin family protein [Ignavibacteriota bacterium]|nr:thioredoxin family protein [Ignavibacteriota bacterium]
MKYIAVLIFVLISNVMFSQDYVLTTDDKKNEPMLMGTITRSLLMENSFGDWFNKSYEIHKLDRKTLNKVNNDFSNLKILIILGTWCGDSHEFVPPFLKILDSLSFPESNLKLICVNRQKQGIADEVKGLEVKLVPLFIFYRDDKEIDRITESPKEGLEKDFLRITSEKQ